MLVRRTFISDISCFIVWLSLNSISFPKFGVYMHQSCPHLNSPLQPEGYCEPWDKQYKVRCWPIAVCHSLVGFPLTLAAFWPALNTPYLLSFCLNTRISYHSLIHLINWLILLKTIVCYVRQNIHVKPLLQAYTRYRTGGGRVLDTRDPPVTPGFLLGVWPGKQP